MHKRHQNRVFFNTYGCRFKRLAPEFGLKEVPGTTCAMRVSQNINAERIFREDTYL